MKKFMIFLILVVFIEISIILILISSVLEKKDISVSIIDSNDTLPKHPNICLMRSNNTKLINELKPNCSVYFDGFSVKLPTTHIKINSDGFRDKEYSIEKPDNTVRIIVLGDSLTFGWGVNISDAYTKVLERKLNSLNNGITYEVLNFGVTGYNTLQEVELLKVKGLKYNPDMIIIEYLPFNDLIDTKEILRIRQELTEKYLKKGFDINDKRIMIKIQVESLKIAQNGLRKKPFQEVFKIVKKPLDELYEITSKRNISVIIATTHSSSELSSEIPTLKKICKDYHWYFVDFLSKPLINKKIKTFQIEILPPKETHPNKLGHNIMAEALFETLLKEKLV